jgi:hypothetical protein
MSGPAAAAHRPPRPARTEQPVTAPDRTDEGLRAAQSIHHDHPRVGVPVFSQYVETRYPLLPTPELTPYRARLYARFPGGALP